MTSRQVQLIDILCLPTLLFTLDHKSLYQIITEARHLSLLGQLKTACELDGIWDELPLFMQQQLLSGFHSFEKQKKALAFEHEELKAQLKDILPSWRYIRGSALQFSEVEMFKGRIKNNIDILISENHVDAVLNQLLNHGWRYKNITDYEETFYCRWSNQTTPLIHKERRTELAIHFHLLPKTLRHKLDETPLLHHHTSPITAHPATLLSPEAMVTHQAIMFFNQVNFKYGLRDLYDLHLQFSHFGKQRLFWHNLIQLHQQIGKDNSLFMALGLCHELFALKIPDNMMQFLNQHASHRFIFWLYKERFSEVIRNAFPNYQNSDYRFAVKSLRFRGRLKRMPLYAILPHIIKKEIINLMPHEEDEEIIY
ncbi:nucleotidyltransferase family protein [Photobacterium leiognathi]|uniref:nucleotidyltransferase family protein n=1 Tax=Photobacterium leiognathi TaxID=553611 RepID=UPI003AF3BF68